MRRWSSQPSRLAREVSLAGLVLVSAWLVLRDSAASSIYQMDEGRYLSRAAYFVYLCGPRHPTA